MSLNLGPLKVFRSRNSIRDSDMLHMSLSVWCTLFSLSRKSRKLSSSSLARCRGRRLCNISKAKAGLVRWLSRARTATNNGSNAMGGLV